MARQVLLGDLNLMNRTTYRVRTAGPQFSEDASGVGSLTCVVPMLLLASTPANLWAARREIERVLEQAREAARDRLPTSQRVELSIQGDDEGWTYADVRGGSISPDSWELFPDGRHAYCTIVLSCLPLLRTESVQAQNLLAAACDPENTAWTLTNITATSDDATAPDGSETAATLRETATSGTHGLAQDVTKAAESQTLTGSVYVQADGRDRVRLSLISGANGARATYRLDTGVISTAAATTGSGWSDPDAAITDVGDGWYRVSVTATTDSTTTATLSIELDNGSGTSYAGDIGKGLLVWGAQVEEAGSAGLLLVPLMLPDTVREAYTETGYTYDTTTTDFSKDSGNLLASEAWDENGMTETTGQSDPSGGSAASRQRETSGTAQHQVTSSSYATPSGLPATYTGALYIKADAGRNTPTVWLSTGNNGPTSDAAVYFTINLTTGALGTVQTSGALVTFVSREVQDVGGGWWWVSITATISSGAARIYLGCHPNGTASYSGNTSYGVYLWRPQVVAGSTIAAPISTTTTTVDPVDHPAETIAAGHLAGAYVYGIPGDADAVYRVEVDDASSGAAVDRLHIGSWSGEDVRLDQPGPFIVATPAEGASSLSDGDGYVGDSIATAGVGPTWQPVAQIPLDDLTGRRGLADLRVRVRDRSPYLSTPASIRAEVADATTMRRLGRAASPAQDSVTSLGLGRPLVTPGSTLVLLCQWTSLTVTSVTLNGGGGSWTSRTGGDNGRVHFRWWTLEDADQLSSGLSVSWASGVVYAAVTLLEISGVAAASYDVARVDTVAPRTGEASDHITTGSITAAQANSILLSVGIGTKYINNPLTAVTTPSTYRAVSTLASGGVAAMSVSSTGPHTATWERMLADAEPEGWIALLAAFKSATMSAADLTPGQWSLCMTAVDADGNESLPTGIVSVSVPSAGSSVHISGTAPLIGTAATYRHYRNRGSGWGYLETSVPAHVWTSEGSVTPANPPTTDMPVAAWRVAIALPSGERAWHAQMVRNSQRANGAWEDIDAGSLPLPPIVAGEGETPTGALIQIEAAHLDGTTVDVNGVWLYGAADGQVVASRSPDDEGDARGWVLDTTRDQTLAAWLRDAASGTESGQPAARGRLTMQPGRALIVLRPEMAGARSDLIASDLQIRRILVTPRWHYIAGRPS